MSDDDGRRAACPPSDLTLLGLIRHMTDVERWWFRRWFVDEDVPPLFDDDEEVARARRRHRRRASLDAYWSEIRAADANIKPASLDDRGRLETGARPPGKGALRRTIVHMIEECARHCGHADLLRQAIDGTTGD